ncbi:MAG: hypothetical protein WCH99_07505 [Verrucomicrobiota bacterium]
MTEEPFKLLARFLSLPEGEVSGRAQPLDGALKTRLRQCAEGRLTEKKRSALCNEIKEHREALAFLAREIQAVTASRNQKITNEPGAH